VSDHVHVTGFFLEEEACLRGIAGVRRAGLEPPRVFSPFPSEHIAPALGLGRSPVRLWILLGGISGCLSGFWLTIGLSLAYPHRTGGMPIVSIPPFVIIAFELTILLGALAGLVGFLVHGGFPRLAPVPGYDPRFSADRFGVMARCHAGDRARVEAALQQAGAVEVTCEPA
jgi:molybdopterin-containing oxidoreductase family membrane subunit